MWATNSDTRVYSGYRVLARKTDRFLLALESSGGGTGRFTDLSWVRLGPTSLADVGDVLGGDRAMLDSGYFPCYGYVNYQYDVLAEHLRLESLTLHPDTQAAARETFRTHAGPQACFDELVREVHEPLQPPEIAAFGRRFLSRCVGTGGAESR
jgi:hypothetical protein